MPRPKQPPVLDPALCTVLRTGGLKPLRLGPFPASTARSFRHRLYRERRKMQELNAEGVDIANQATIALQAHENNPHQLILCIYPANLLIQEALSRAGITNPNDPPPLD